MGSGGDGGRSRSRNSRNSKNKSRVRKIDDSNSCGEYRSEKIQPAVAVGRKNNSTDERVNGRDRAVVNIRTMSRFSTA